jgi:hypothetical protein
MTCPHCHQDARCQGFRPRRVVGRLGPMRLWRHYYHCRHCHQGPCPRDGLRGLRAHDLTPAADEVVCLAGLLGSFAAAAEDILVRLAALRLGESTVERSTEAAGTRVAAARAAGQTFGGPALGGDL